MNNIELSKETILEANNYIKKLLTGIDYIVDNFLAGREDLALNSFANLIDGLEWLINVIKYTEPVLLDLEIKFPSNDNVTTIMSDMMEAFENSDYVLVGDLLNFELKPTILEWQEKFELAESRIK